MYRYTMCTSVFQACTTLCLFEAQTLASRPCKTLCQFKKHNLVLVWVLCYVCYHFPSLFFLFNNQHCLCRLAFTATFCRFLLIQSDIYSAWQTISTQTLIQPFQSKEVSSFFAATQSMHTAQPYAIQDQDCQSLAIKTCTLHNHVLSLSSKYLNFYLLFFNSFPPFFSPSFLLNSLSDCMLSYLLYAEVFFLEWISFQAEVFCFTFWMNLLSSSFIATGKHFHCNTEAESLHCHTEANVLLPHRLNFSSLSD